jgi:hypothetical protein
MKMDHPIDREFALLRASYADEEAAILRHSRIPVLFWGKKCLYCGETGVYKSGTWKHFCSSVCAVQYLAVPRNIR